VTYSTNLQHTVDRPAADRPGAAWAAGLAPAAKRLGIALPLLIDAARYMPSAGSSSSSSVAALAAAEPAAAVAAVAATDSVAAVLAEVYAAAAIAAAPVAAAQLAAAALAAAAEPAAAAPAAALAASVASVAPVDAAWPAGAAWRVNVTNPDRPHVPAISIPLPKLLSPQARCCSRPPLTTTLSPNHNP
jgi:hypothetical protein